VQVPAPAPEPELVEEVPDLIPELVEDEETIAAAPDASAFVRRHVPRPVHTPIYASLFFRRTIIPILLTCGGCLSAMGLWSMVDRDAPLAAMGVRVEIVLIAIGVMLLALGIVNALHVKHILDTAAKRETA
jgi:hypothetical protein